MTSALLVTGAGGVLGSRLVTRVAEDRTTQIVATFRGRTDRLMTPPPAGVQYVRCDLSSRAELTELFSKRRFGAVVHAAASLPATGADNFDSTLQDNIVAQAQLVSAARAGGVALFIFCSSISVYEPFTDFDEDATPNPLNTYARSKYIGEQILQMAAGKPMAGVSLRLAGLHGPDRADGVVHNMISAAHRQVPFSVTEPDSRFRLCFIDDAVDAISNILRMPSPPRRACYNIAGRDTYTLSALAKRIWLLTSSSSEIHEVRPSPARNMVMPILRAEQDLDYRPRGLDEHLNKMIARVRGS
ncbi:MAG: NAD-dependent epimerase/dehydratase family protein [Alphaproteobacteria bacterium]